MAPIKIRGRAAASLSTVMASLSIVMAIAVGACSSAGTPRSASTTSRPAPPSSGVATPASTSTPAALAADAYVWGLPLVVSMRTAQTFARLIGVDRLFNQQKLSGPGRGVVVAPNVDTLYSIAVIDLRSGPVVLTVPAIHDRYYTYQFLDMYTESFAYVGTRATAGAAGSWVIAPIGWAGAVPVGDHLIRATTPLVFLLGRFLVAGTSDVPTVRGVMAQVRLAPLASSVAGSSPVAASLGAPPGTPQSVSSAGAAFFDELGAALAVNPPPTAADRAALARFAPLGVGSGRHPAAKSTQAQRAALTQGVSAGAKRVAGAVGAPGHVVNGWQTRSGQLGRYGDDFLLRAVVAQSGWGANVPEEAVYVGSVRDARGDLYSGSQAYVMHFAAGSLPPAKAFWSLTVYGLDGFLVANPADRYAVGDRTPGLQTNRDGSVDFYLQHDPPAGHQSNWLPTPAGGFRLITRIYLPEPRVLDGSYELPPVEPAP
jgi:hypothetical protein